MKKEIINPAFPLNNIDQNTFINDIELNLNPLEEKSANQLLKEYFQKREHKNKTHNKNQNGSK